MGRVDDFDSVSDLNAFLKGKEKERENHWALSMQFKKKNVAERSTL